MRGRGKGGQVGARQAAGLFSSDSGKSPPVEAICTVRPLLRFSYPFFENYANSILPHPILTPCPSLLACDIIKKRSFWGNRNEPKKAFVFVLCAALLPPSFSLFSAHKAEAAPAIRRSVTVCAPHTESGSINPLASLNAADERFQTGGPFTVTGYYKFKKIAAMPKETGNTPAAHVFGRKRFGYERFPGWPFSGRFPQRMSCLCGYPSLVYGRRALHGRRGHQKRRRRGGVFHGRG